MFRWPKNWAIWLVKELATLASTVYKLKINTIENKVKNERNLVRRMLRTA